MKRSKWIKLSIMGAATGSLIGCSQEPTVPVVNYSDISECVNDRQFTEQECVAQYQQAKAASAEDAPKYENSQDCQTDFGQQGCYNNGGLWQPLMAGFMMSRMAGAVGAGLSGNSSRPLYRSNDDRSAYRTANNVRTGQVGDTRPRSAPNSLMSASQAKVYSRSGSMGARANTMSRGGFGKSTQRSSGWGG
ncbi:DUF1190 domain-containing protein [Echinimonas agarilytica]|uniref:DUF1190 domain-containing protein n=1 Tax=Echinimonas agarilytica TaxID=1215918 RepID=A0AA41W768_9GAMM|nr:DUF1190 domain-containing protein [Echinimonas agarilytica]MCM2679907.1 DUF1190 domain-containing protein [Echinimonas agarilytica]